jgi:hypothetical protein
VSEIPLWVLKNSFAPSLQRKTAQTCAMACLHQLIDSPRTCLGGCREVQQVLGAPEVCIEAPVSELYDDTGRNPALTVLGLAVKLGHKPICLHYANSDPFPKPDV